MTDTNSQEKTWGMLCHLLALCGLVVPFGHLLGPLVWWLIKKDESPAVNCEGKESLNFQITATIFILLLGGVTVVLMFILVGFLLLPLLVVLGLLANVVFPVIAAIQTNNTGSYRYPLTIRFLK